MRRLAVRAPKLDIFSDKLVVRETNGWQITDRGREFLSSLEAPTAATRDPEQWSGPDQAIAVPTPVQPVLRLVVDNTRSSLSGRGCATPRAEVPGLPSAGFSLTSHQ